MGLALARSITGSVHELFAGTERVRRGDFTGHVSIRSRDQLGELAESFNSMTSSIEDLLQQKAEKERLEQELRIARNIQMSLLPQGPLIMPGLDAHRALRTGARSGRRLLRLPADRRPHARHSHRRRLGQGDVRGALHGGAQGHRALAQPAAPLAARSADRGRPHHLAPSRQPELHHGHLSASSISAPARCSTRAPATAR